MSKKYTVTLSDAEDKAMQHIAYSVKEWIDNLVHERARVAIDEIVNSEVQRKLSIGEPITGTKEDIVLAANIETAAERNSRLESELAKLQEQQG